MKTKKPTTTYRSDAYNIVQRIKNTLYKVDLELARCETEINLRKEKIDFYSMSTKKRDLKALTLAKVELENYEVFSNRLKTYKTAFLRRINTISERYQGEYGKIFLKRYIENKTTKQIAEELNLKEKAVWQIVKRLDRAVEDEFKHKKKGDD